jgi:hypothetical protein
LELALRLRLSQAHFQFGPAHQAMTESKLDLLGVEGAELALPLKHSLLTKVL